MKLSFCYRKMTAHCFMLQAMYLEVMSSNTFTKEIVGALFVEKTMAIILPHHPKQNCSVSFSAFLVA